MEKGEFFVCCLLLLFVFFLCFVSFSDFLRFAIVRYVAMLGTMQTAIKRLKDDGLKNRELVREVMAQFAVLKAFCEHIWDKTHPPLEAWKSELSSAFSKLIVKFHQVKDVIEDTKDDVRRAQLAKEEERSKTLMLEESVSRLEHEISTYEMKISEAEALPPLISTTNGTSGITAFPVTAVLS